MNLKILIFGLFLILCAKKCEAQEDPSISCRYYTDHENKYCCDLKIKNKNGFNEFSKIDGEHEPGKSGTDVEKIYGWISFNSKNFPSIVCNKHTNTNFLRVYQVGLESLEAGSFKSCSVLKTLTVSYCGTSKLDEGAFENLGALANLHMEFNKIKELPANIFKPLPKLYELKLNNNLIEVLPANLFENNPKLDTVYLFNNRIRAVSPTFAPHLSKISTIWISDNVCINKDFLFVNEDAVKESLKTCYENYSKI